MTEGPVYCMKKRIAAAIVRFRIGILICILIIATWSVFQIGRTKINYDLTRYLSDDTMTKKALAVMQEEFGTTEQLRLLFENQDETALKSIMDRLQDMPEILAVQHDPETDRKQQDGTDWQLVTITLNDCDAAALDGETVEGKMTNALDGERYHYTVRQIIYPGYCAVTYQKIA